MGVLDRFLRSVDSWLLNLDARFDENGNPSDIYDVARGGTYNLHLQYDARDRLIAAGSGAFGGDGWHRYTYDALDNIKSWKLGSGGKDYANYYYDPGTNRLLGIRDSAGAAVVGLAYDVQGNLQNKSGQLYGFGFDNRLYIAAGKEQYRYDGEGRRVLAWSPVDGTSALSQYSKSGQLMYYYKNSGAGLEHIYLSGSLIAKRETVGNVVTFQHTDALGSPVAVTDGSGNVIERNDYTPYGAVVGKPAYDAVGYTGHKQDGATGLTYMQQRYYDPMIGRFLSVDPVTAYSNPIGAFNRYWYATNNPYKFTDPDGRSEMNVFGAHDRYGLRTAGDAFEIPGMFSVTGHANPDFIQDQRNPDEYLNMRSHTSVGIAQASFGLKEGGTVFMAACHTGIAPVGLNKSIGQLWADFNNSTVYAPDGFVMYPKNYSGGAITLRVSSQENGGGAPGVWNRFVPGGSGPAGRPIDTVRINTDGSATVKYSGLELGTRIPTTQRVTKEKSL